MLVAIMGARHVDSERTISKQKAASKHFSDAVSLLVSHEFHPRGHFLNMKRRRKKKNLCPALVTPLIVRIIIHLAKHPITRPARHGCLAISRLVQHRGPCRRRRRRSSSGSSHRRDRRRPRGRRRAVIVVVLAGRCRGVQPLVQRLERQRAPSLGLCARTAGRAAAVAALLVAVRRATVVALWEGRAQAHGDEDVEDSVGGLCDDGFDGAWEELGEGEGFCGVAAHGGGGGVVGRLGGVEVWEDGLVEAQVGEGGKEAVQGEEEGGGGEERGEGEEEDQGEVEEGEARDAKGEEAAKEGDCMGGNELREGDEEADLERDRAGDCGQAGGRRGGVLAWTGREERAGQDECGREEHTSTSRYARR